MSTVLNSLQHASSCPCALTMTAVCEIPWAHNAQCSVSKRICAHVHESCVLRTRWAIIMFILCNCACCMEQACPESTDHLYLRLDSCQQLSVWTCRIPPSISSALCPFLPILSAVCYAALLIIMQCPMGALQEFSEDLSTHLLYRFCCK